MNAQRAKKLRGTGSIGDAQEVRHLLVPFKNMKGEKRERFMLDPRCGRASYKRAKKAFKGLPVMDRLTTRVAHLSAAR